MHEIIATSLMRAAQGWTEHPTLDGTYLFQCGDATMRILPGGSWECKIPVGLVQDIRRGTIHELARFLEDFEDENHY